MSDEAVLAVADLRVAFPGRPGGRAGGAADEVRAVDGVGWAVRAGATLGIVGESGSGKSVGALALLGLLGPSARVSGTARFAGRDLLALPPRELRAVRGARIALVPQDPLAALHPLMRVGDQIAEGVRAHERVSRREALRRAAEGLERTGIPEPGRRLRAYPHELSGGMRQRAMIAMALVHDPDVLIADEPTTALDVTVQAQVLALLAEQRAQRGMALVLVTHDLAVVAQVADEVAVMYAGRVVERAPTCELFARPEHPYTWGLLRSSPRVDDRRGRALEPIPGRPPAGGERPPGCAFHPRCAYARPAHAVEDPRLDGVRPGHEVACLLPGAARAAIRSALAEGQPAAAARAAGEGAA